MTGPLLFRIVANTTVPFMKGDDGMIKNKIYSILMLAVGGIAMAISKDATLLVLMSLFAIPMFFSKHEWIM